MGKPAQRSSTELRWVPPSSALGEPGCAAPGPKVVLGQQHWSYRCVLLKAQLPCAGQLGYFSGCLTRAGVRLDTAFRKDQKSL